MTVGMLEACIKKAGGKLLRSIQLFDIYRGPGIAPGKKSVAFSLEPARRQTARSPMRTPRASRMPFWKNLKTTSVLPCDKSAKGRAVWHVLFVKRPPGR